MMVATLWFECECATLGALTGMAVASYMFLVVGPAATMRRLAWIPEGRWKRPWYTAEDVAACMAQLGSDGPRLYQRQLVWDMVYAVLYAIALSLLLDGTWGRLFRNPSFAIVLPAITAAAADLAENLLLITAISTRGDTNPALIRTAAVWTVVKWTAAVVTIGAIVVGAFFLAFGGPGSLGV